MTPQNFAERMRATVDASMGEREVLDALAFDLMLEALSESGFHEGALILVKALPERLPAALVAQVVERARTA